MSRTWVHMPPHVKERHPEFRRHFVAEHDHWIEEDRDLERHCWLVRRSAPCDLDVYLASEGRINTRCRLAYRGGRNIYCGCALCTGAPFMRLTRRRERHQWKAIRQRLLAGEEIDVPLIRVSAW